MSVPSLALHNMECFHLFSVVSWEELHAMIQVPWRHTLYPTWARWNLFFFEGEELESVFRYIKYFYFLNASLEESIKNWLLPNPHTPLFTRNFIKCFIKILRMFQHLNHVEWLSSCDHKISSNHTWLDKKVLFSKQGHILKTVKPCLLSLTVIFVFRSWSSHP